MRELCSVQGNFLHTTNCASHRYSNLLFYPPLMPKFRAASLVFLCPQRSKFLSRMTFCAPHAHLTPLTVLAVALGANRKGEILLDASLKLRLWRRSRRLTVQRLAEKSRLSLQQLEELEDQRQSYDQRLLQILAEALECAPGDLLTEPPEIVLQEVAGWKHPHRVSGHYLREWREHRGLTLEDLSGLTGMSHTNLSRIERGLVPYAQGGLEKLAAALNTDPASLILVPPETATGATWLAALAPEKQAQLIRIAHVLVDDPGTAASSPAPSPSRAQHPLVMRTPSVARKKISAPKEPAPNEPAPVRLSHASLAKLAALKKYR